MWYVLMGVIIAGAILLAVEKIIFWLITIDLIDRAIPRNEQEKRTQMLKRFLTKRSRMVEKLLKDKKIEEPPETQVTDDEKAALEKEAQAQEY
jgi:hypothetical protein